MPIKTKMANKIFAHDANRHKQGRATIASMRAIIFLNAYFRNSAFNWQTSWSKWRINETLGRPNACIAYVEEINA